MRFVWCLAVALIGLSCPAMAVEAPLKLEADGCAALAVEQNRLVRAARQEAVAARQSLKETGAQRLPRLTTSASYVRINGADETAFGAGAGASGLGAAGGAGAFGAIEESKSADLSLIQPLADLVGLGHAVGIARLEATIAQLDEASAENEVAFAARRAFYTVLTLEKTVESVEQTITEFEETLKVVRNYREQGRVLQRDVNKADIAVEQAKLGLLRTQHALQSARTGLRDVLGLELDAPVELVPTEAVEAFDLTLDECLATAAVQRPDLRAVALQHAAAERGVSLARSAYVPSIGAALSYQWEHTDLTAGDDSVAVGLNWSWDVWDWGRRRAAVRGAEAMGRAALLAAENAQHAVAIEVERLRLAVTLAHEKIRVAKKDWDYAKENVRVSKVQYDNGTLLITDLLDDQTGLNDARIAYYVSVYDHAIALADLRRAMGER